MNALMLAAALAIPVLSSHAQDPPRGDRASLLMTRALSYDRKLRSRAGDDVHLTILTVDGHDDQVTVDTLMALQGATVAGLPLAISVHPWTTPEALTDAIESKSIDVVLISAGFSDDLSKVSAITREHDTLTLAGDGRFVEQGLSLGVLTHGDRLQFVVNLPASRQEGAAFSSELLQLAQVIR